MRRAKTGEEYLERILSARVYDVAVETPLDAAPLLSRRTGHTVLLKREDLQPVHSFKLRGAYNRMARLSPAALRRGVIAASAGNHAQGVALAAKRLGCSATIVMPVTTPRIKVDAVKSRGARVVLTGDSYDEAYAEARRIAGDQKRTFVHPYDDPDVIAGQGTIGMEILRQRPAGVDAIFVAIGGGGLAAGVAAYVKRISPKTKIVGVEPVDSDAMWRSSRAGRRVRLERVGLFADGVAVKQVGKETFRLCRDLLDEVVRVDTDAICAAIKDVFEDTRSILEPAGALAVAGLKAWAEKRKTKGKTLVAVACGANMNFDRLRFVAERAQLGEKREAILAVTIPERPGSFREFCAIVGRRSITEFNYRYADATDAHVFVGVEVENPRQTAALIGALRRNGPSRPRPDRERDGEAPRPAPRRRPRAGGARRAALPVRVSRAARRAPELPRPPPERLEHQPLPLPQPRSGLRPRPRGHPGAEEGRREVPALPLRARLPPHGRDEEPRVPAVPGVRRLRAPSARPPT